jgi:ribosomal protein L25 (general stress protein Ctc)
LIIVWRRLVQRNVFVAMELKVMSEKIVVKAQIREGRGKNDTRRLRATGRIPVSIYGGGGEAVAATAELKDVAAVIRSKDGVETVFSVEIEGAGVHEVRFGERQIDAVHGRLTHVDLLRVN